MRDGRKSQRSTLRRLRFEANRNYRLHAMKHQRAWDKRYGREPDCMAKYTLRGKEPVRQPNLMKWGRWVEENRITGRRIGNDYIGEDVRVSTVFLGVDHGFDRMFDPSAPAILFETMIFGGEYNDRMFRYATWDEARAVHVAIVETLKTNKLLGETLDELGIQDA